MADQGARRVLIVEDDDLVRGMVADVLADEGYEVREAANGRRALVLLGEWLPHLILLDLMMPEMDGYTFRAKQLQSARLARIPVIIMSASHNLRRPLEHLKAADLLPKPFDLVQLLVKVEAIAA
jgi:CheY-like chemotaxis protein